MRPTAPGVFISFEGGEGSGKSTQIKLLKDHLEAAGYPVVTTREPGGVHGAELIRDLVLKGDVDRWQPMTEALMMTASRAEHVACLIKPKLKEGKIVISDRFADSSVAYQGAARGVGMERVKALQKVALGDFSTDLTLVLDLPVETGLDRAMSREAAREDSEDRFERMGTDFHRVSIAAFHQIAEDDPERCRLIDARRSIEEIHEEIVRHVDLFLEQHSVRVA